MLDLAKNNFAQSAELGYEFELKLPTGENTGAFIKVRGDQSASVKAFARRKYNELKAKETAARRRGKEPDEMTLEDAEEMAIEAAIVRVISWRGITENGEVVPFTAENAARVFKDHPWIREQISEESALLVNFRPA